MRRASHVASGGTLKPEGEGRMIASTLISTEFSPTAREWLRAVPEPTKEVPHMPTTKELTIRTEDRPGTLAKVCKALAERKVNILAFQSVPAEGNSVVRFIADNPATAKKVLDNQGLRYTETDVAQIKLPHQPGELARAASRLGEANININYAYGGVDPSTNAPLMIFGVREAGQAAKILDRIAADSTIRASGRGGKASTCLAGITRAPVGTKKEEVNL